MCVYLYASKSMAPPILTFMAGLDSKLQRKLDLQIRQLATTPVSALTEPHYKHFTIQKYSRLFELRERGKILVRIIFTVRDDGSVILLKPFIKNHKRTTMQALDASLKMLSEIESGGASLLEYGANSVYEKEDLNHEARCVGV